MYYSDLCRRMAKQSDNNKLYFSKEIAIQKGVKPEVIKDLLAHK